MDLDDLIPIFIFGAVFLTSILKRLAQKAKKAPSEKKPSQTKPQGLIQTLRVRLERMMAEAARQQQSPNENPPYYDESDGYDDYDGHDDDTVDMSENLELTPAPTSKGSMAVSRPAPVSGPGGRGLAVASIRAPSRQSLRQAVIWAEILGPPKALGDVQGNSPLLSQKEGR